jgi:hypothetical protein
MSQEIGYVTLSHGMSLSVKTKSLVKSRTCLVKVKLLSFGPVIVRDVMEY